MTSPRPSSPGYDTSSIHVRGVLIFIAGFLLTLALILFSIWHYERHLLASQPNSDPRVLSPQFPTLPQPLQTNEAQDLLALRTTAQSQLHSTGPLPNDPAHIHIPIDAAIDKLLNSSTLDQPWQNPTTQPFQRPPAETNPSVENRT